MRYWVAVIISGMGMGFMAGLSAAHSPWWWGSRLRIHHGGGAASCTAPCAPPFGWRRKRALRHIWIGTTRSPGER